MEFQVSHWIHSIGIVQGEEEGEQVYCEWSAFCVFHGTNEIVRRTRERLLKSSDSGGPGRNFGRDEAY